MRFFGLDGHAALSRDVAATLAALGHSVTIRSIAADAPLFPGTPPIRGIDGTMLRGLAPDLVDGFWKEHGAEIDTCDAILVTHLASLTLLADRATVPVLFVMDARYDQGFTLEPERWAWLDDHLRRGANEGWLVVGSTTRADAEYLHQHTAVAALPTPSLHLETPSGWGGADGPFGVLVHHGEIARELGIPDPVPVASAWTLLEAVRSDPSARHWADHVATLRGLGAMIHFPGQTLGPALATAYAAGVPTFVPSADLLEELHQRHPGEVLHALTFAQLNGLRLSAPSLAAVHRPHIRRAWIELADWTDPTWYPQVRQFVSAADLAEQLHPDRLRAVADEMAADRSRRADAALACWSRAIEAVAVAAHGATPGPGLGDRSASAFPSSAASTDAPRRGGTIALLVPVTSRGRPHTRIEETELVTTLLPSLVRTMARPRRFPLRLYVGIDSDDPLWDTPEAAADLHTFVERILPLTSPCRVTLAAIDRFDDVDGAVTHVWNGLFEHAIADGCDWFFQLGDDIAFVNAGGWDARLTRLLDDHPDVPGLGVAGPLDLGNQRLLTQSMVSKVHHDIFGTYYPPEIRNWYCDDWITEVYRPTSTTMDATSMVHNRGGEPRYRPDTDPAPFEAALAEGRQRFRHWWHATVSDQLDCLLSYSLWGDAPQHQLGACENAAAAATFYPGWRTRFYIARDVPAATVERLTQLGAELVLVDEEPGWRGLFWRFGALAEGDADVVVFRDCDSRLSRREADAVTDWLISGRPVHIMRDHPWHTTEILGGMWGARRGAVPDFGDRLATWPERDAWGTDQNFLSQAVWPDVQRDAYVHDEFFRYEVRRRPFPTDRVGLEFVGASVGVDGVPPDQTDALAAALGIDT